MKVEKIKKRRFKLLMVSKLYGTDATILTFLILLFCIVWCGGVASDRYFGGDA